MSSPGTPPKKSWAQLVKDTPAREAHKKEAPDDKPTGDSGKSAAPQPKVMPKPAAKTLPPTSSKTSVQPCFSSLAERGYPLGFESRESFVACMQDLCNTAQKQGIKCDCVGVRGSAATYHSSNPNKKGQYFDSRGEGKSDIDAFLVTDTRLKCWPNSKGFFHPDKVANAYPALADWGKTWTGKLGREITPAAHKSTSPALDEPYIEYACDK